MRDLTLEVIDADHIKTAWNMYEGGKNQEQGDRRIRFEEQSARSHRQFQIQIVAFAGTTADRAQVTPT